MQAYVHYMDKETSDYMHRAHALNLRQRVTDIWSEAERDNKPINYLSHEVRIAMEMLWPLVEEAREKNIDSFALAMSLMKTAACGALCDLPRHQCELFAKEAIREIEAFEGGLDKFFRTHLEQVGADDDYQLPTEVKDDTRKKEIELNKVDLYLSREWGRPLDELKSPPTSGEASFSE